MLPRFTPDPRSVPGDFYVQMNECAACGVPQSVAPELVNWVDEEPYLHCGWIKQPSTAKEMKQAIEILQKQELGCHRYCGNDPQVLKMVPECCDYFLDPEVAMPEFKPAYLDGKKNTWLRRMWRKLTRKRSL